MSASFEQSVRSGGAFALQEAERFLMGEGPVHSTLQRIARKLDELGIPYAVAGGMALVAHGYLRTTVDVDILVNVEGLQRIHEELSGLGYVEPFQGSKNLRDTTSNVRIEFLISGRYPGDGKPKPVSFPDPAQAGVRVGGISYVRLETLLELKLASGMTGGVSRLKDLADVVELIKTLNLPRATADTLNEYVRPKFLELWDGIASA
jgi:hypothetical protein